MLKRIILATALMCALAVCGQNGVGNWRVHPYYVGSEIKTIIDTEHHVYYLVGNYLFGLDKDTDENESYNKSNYLNDVTVTGIYYNHQRHYLVVTYANSAMDVIDDSGNVTYLSDIKDAVLTSQKGINDITFDNDRMYVATQFGYVTYDAVKLEVITSRIYGQDVSSIARVGDWLVMAQGGVVRAAPASAHNESLSSFQPLDPSLGQSNNARLLAIDNTTMLCNADNGLCRLGLGTDGDAPTLDTCTVITASRAAQVQRSHTGYVASYLSGDSCYYTLDAQGPQCHSGRCSTGAVQLGPGWRRLAVGTGHSWSTQGRRHAVLLQARWAGHQGGSILHGLQRGAGTPLCHQLKRQPAGRMGLKDAHRHASLLLRWRPLERCHAGQPAG